MGKCVVTKKNLQIKRNCCGYYEKANNMLNGNLYPSCPRSVIFNQRESRYLVDLYFECKENKCYPAPGTIYDQTAYTCDLFDFIDVIVNKYRAKKLAEQEAKNKPQTNKKK